MNATAGKIIIDGNCRLRARLRCSPASRCVTWYPITPSSSLVETMIGYMRRFRIDPETGKATYAVVQAEDELASIGMAIGAGWAGARSMTSTAGPGISLMSEFIGLGYYAEVPGRGLSTSSASARRRACPRAPSRATCSPPRSSPTATPSTPCSSRPRPRSASRWRIEAFDFAEQFQTPVFVMTDLDLGMNNWMADPFEYPETARSSAARCSTPRISSGSAGSPGTRTWTATASATARCPAPTIPRRRTSPAAAATTRRRSTPSAKTITSTTWIGSPHKFEMMRKHVPAPARPSRRTARRSASSRSAPRDYAVRGELRSACSSEYDIAASYLRLKAYPFNDGFEGFHRSHDRVYVVDQNRDAQLLGLMRLEFDAGADREAAQRALLRRPAARRAHGHR